MRTDGRALKLSTQLTCADLHDLTSYSLIDLALLEILPAPEHTHINTSINARGRITNVGKLSAYVRETLYLITIYMHSFPPRLHS